MDQHSNRANVGLESLLSAQSVTQAQVRLESTSAASRELTTASGGQAIGTYQFARSSGGNDVLWLGTVNPTVRESSSSARPTISIPSSTALQSNSNNVNLTEERPRRAQLGLELIPTSQIPPYELTQSSNEGNVLWFGTATQSTRESSSSGNNRGRYDFNRVYPEPPLREGRRTVVRFKSLRLQWNIANPCPHCGCVLFFVGDEPKIRQKCCSNGHILRNNNSFPHLRPLPPALLNYCLNYKNHMGRNAVSYNNLLSLGACGIENESESGGFETIHGDHSLLLHGRTYHFLPNNTRTGGLYFFTYDAMQEMQSYGDRTMNTRNENGEIKHYRFYRNIGEALFNEQAQINYLVRECIAQGNLARQEIMPRLNLSTTAFDIASIVSEDANRPNRRIVFQLRNEPYPSSISLRCITMEPLCYPIFFPYGEKGWGDDIRKQYKFHDYILHRFLLPERDISGRLLLMPTQSTPPRSIPFSRFQLMFRLGQTYLVDMISRIIDYRLQFNAFTQYTLFGQTRPTHPDHDVNNFDEAITTSHDNNDEEKEGDENKKSTFLSQNFHGSRRHLLNLAQNAICLVSEFGRPTLFITFTCNPNWPEIKEMLFEGETAYDRADITTKVFHEKLDRFLFNMRNGKYFGQRHKPTYELRVIEYQQRGLPHAHMVFQLDNIPDWKTEKEELALWIDENINATFPAINSLSTDRLKFIHSLIKTHMTHKCYKGDSGCIDEKTGVCKRGFDTNVVQDCTTLDERGFPHYKRNTEEDCKVVSHNVLILEDLNAHVNVEYTGSTYCVIYLYKYLFKGRKKVSENLINLKPFSIILWSGSSNV